MLKRTERIRRHDFGKVALGRASHTPLFTIRALPVEGELGASKQFSVVVSKKVAKTAVARNALRRKVYAALAESGPCRGHAIFYMKPEALQASYETMRTVIGQALKSSHIA